MRGHGLVLGITLALTTVCGARQAVPDSPAPLVSPGRWCAAAGPMPAYFAVANAVFPARPSSPDAWPPPFDSAAPPLPEPVGVVDSVALVDVGANGETELLVARRPDPEMEGSSQLSLYRCGTDGWSLWDDDVMPYGVTGPVLQVLSAELAPRTSDVVLEVRESSVWLGEVLGGLLALRTNGVDVWSDVLGDTEQRVVVEGNSGDYYGRFALPSSGWLPIRDGEGHTWTGLVLDYGYVPADEYDPYPEDEQLQAYRQVIVERAATAQGGAIVPVDQWLAPAFVVVGFGEPPQGCERENGCVALGDADAVVLGAAPRMPRWLAGTWLQADEALRAADAWDDVVVLGSNQALYDLADARGLFDDDGFALPPETIDPRLRASLPLEP